MAKKVEPAALTAMEEEAGELAGRLALHLIVAETDGKKHWTISSRRTGRRVMLYYPACLHWQTEHHSGWVQHWRDAMRKAATVARQGND